MKRSVLILSSVLFFVSSFVWAQEPEDAEARALYDNFIAKAESIWQDRTERLLRYSGVCRCTVPTDPSNPTTSPRRDCRMIWDADLPNVVFEGDDTIVPEGSPALSFIMGRNKKYAFQLQKEGVLEEDPSKGEWKLDFAEGFEAQTTRADVWDRAMGKRADYETFLDFYMTTFLNEFVLPDSLTTVMRLLLSPECIVEKCAKLENGALRIYFKIEADEEEAVAPGTKVVADGRFFFKSGTVDLMPDDGRVLASTLSYGGYEEEMQCEYESDGAFPLLTSKKTIKKHSDGKTEENVFTFERSIKSFKSKRFTVAHYGLPEPDMGTAPADRSRLIVMVVGLILVAFGAARVYRRMKRRA